MLGHVPWLGHVIFEHASYTANMTMFRDLVFPYLKGSTNVYLNFAYTGSDGKLHLPPTNSPEYPYPHGPANDTHYDLALFKWSAETLLELATTLDIADPLIPVWQDAVSRLTPFPVNEHGFMVDSVNGFDIPHSTFSHLFAIYPLHLTTWDAADGGSNASQALIATSLDRWTGLTCPGGCPHGFTYDGAASISALIAPRAAAASGNISGFMYSGMMHAATLYSEGHLPCMESPGGAAAVLQEMILQSWGGRLRIFQGVPDTWTDLVFHRLGAEGGFAVSAVKAAGALSWLALEAIDYVGGGGERSDETQILRSVVVVAEGLGPASAVSTIPPGVPLSDAPGGAIAFSIAVGSTVILYQTSAPPASFNVTALPGNVTDFNYWGKHPR